MTNRSLKIFGSETTREELVLGAKRLGYRGETTRVENRGETTRVETTRGETSWGRNVLLPHPATLSEQSTPANNTRKRVWQYIEKEKRKTLDFSQKAPKSKYPQIGQNISRLRAKKGPAPPPLGNFADISYLEENFKPHLLRDVCTLCSGALVCDSLLHMLL